MTVKELYDIYRSAARELYDERESASLAAVIVRHFYGLDKAVVYISGGENIEPCPAHQIILRDIRSGRPVQYITGIAFFRAAEFRVCEGVLVPRPETEELVELVLAQKPHPVNILDVGSGSGAIAVSLAMELPGARITALDIQPVAKEITLENASRNGVEIDFILADIFSMDLPFAEGSLDVIVSNPPYIPLSDKTFMHLNVVGHEPHRALFVQDDDPLIFYRAIARHGLKWLAPGGRIYFEIYEKYGGLMYEMLTAMGYEEVVIRQDINGKARFAICTKRL